MSDGAGEAGGKDGSEVVSVSYEDESVVAPSEHPTHGKDESSYYSYTGSSSDEGKAAAVAVPVAVGGGNESEEGSGSYYSGSYYYSSS